MIIEQITVTETPKTILELVLTARGVSELQKPAKIKEILFRTATDGTSKIYVQESSTTTPVTLLDPADLVDPQSKASFSDFDLSECLLSSESGNVVVEIIASQDGRK